MLVTQWSLPKRLPDGYEKQSRNDAGSQLGQTLHGRPARIACWVCMRVRTAQDGIVFIDEIDKIVAGSGGRSWRGGDPSSEGVQRDLLPIIEVRGGAGRGHAHMHHLQHSLARLLT